MKSIKKSRIFSLLLCCLMFLGLLPMGQVAHAEGDVSFELSPSAITIATSAEGYDSGKLTQHITVKNTGIKAEIRVLDSESFIIFGPNNQPIDPNEEKKFGIRPKEGLTEGTYQENIAIQLFDYNNAANNTVAYLPVTFTVYKEVEDFEIIPSNVIFPSETVGYSSASWETVTLKNTGNVTLNYSGPLNLNYFEIRLLAGQTGAPGEEGTFQVYPKIGLAAGTYNETLTVKGTNQHYSNRTVSRTMNLSFTVTESAIPDTCTVTFDANGHGTAPDAQEVENGQKATKPDDPAEIGWTFGGWYTEADCSNVFNFDTLIVDDIRLYAKWTENALPQTYTVTIASPIEHGSVTADKISGLAEGELVTLTITPDEGYELQDLIIKDDGTNPVSMETEKTFKMPAANVNVDAVFKKSSSVMLYAIHVENGKAMIGSLEVTVAKEGDAVTLIANPAPAGKEFNKWIVTGAAADDETNPTTGFVVGTTAVHARATYKDIGTLGTYNIHINPMTNGTVTSDKGQAAEGELVSLTVIPDTGYELASLEVLHGMGLQYRLMRTTVSPCRTRML